MGSQVVHDGCVEPTVVIHTKAQQLFHSGTWLMYRAFGESTTGGKQILIDGLKCMCHFPLGDPRHLSGITSV